MKVIDFWVRQRDRGFAHLPDIPDEVYEGDITHLEAYLDALQLSAFSNSKRIEKSSSVVSDLDCGIARVVLGQVNDTCAYSRRKICVIGPSGSGKTSFIKSFVGKQSVLEPISNRTVGVDVFTWQFDPVAKNNKKSRNNSVDACRRYWVSMWDFAGQDEFYPAHALYFSRRTLYLLCIDLKAYSNAMQGSQIDDFFLDHISRWIHIICVHVPDAEFLLVGMKTDLLGNGDATVGSIYGDIHRRFEAQQRNELTQLTERLRTLQLSVKAGQAAPVQVAELEFLLKARPKFRQEFIVFSNTNSAGFEDAKHILERIITASDTSVLLPDNYNAVLSVARGLANGNALSICSLNDLQQQVELQGVDVSEEAFGAILHLLHDQGELFWFDGAGYGESLHEIVFLAPALVMELIRQVTPHDGTTIGVQSDGVLYHRILSSLPRWRDLDAPSIAYLKRLLQQLFLVYPADGDMLATSDLIIPIYWRTHDVQTPQWFRSNQNDVSMNQVVGWEYQFEARVPQDLFEKLAVQSYQATMEQSRTYGRGHFEVCESGEFCALVEQGRSPVPNLRIHVRARRRDVAWRELVRLGVSTEQLLSVYRGAFVNRYALYDHHSPKTTRVPYDQLVVDAKFARALERGLGVTILPPELMHPKIDGDLDDDNQDVVIMPLPSAVADNAGIMNALFSRNLELMNGRPLKTELEKTTQQTTSRDIRCL
ncbi:TPA: hypothetical protein N0F65_003355 [Lagenidium giganteum]|uniref:Uncharacterized protein n=1 Tax=Lagenidium giganteum TaxID=4803 RepID=A0AAV2ZD40_9STRA|nr:TPA: hypothetical protein N0F65_003355 [Lagenidium giganteum]